MYNIYIYIAYDITIMFKDLIHQKLAPNHLGIPIPSTTGRFQFGLHAAPQRVGARAVR